MTSNRFEHSWPALSCSFNLLRNEFKIGERAISFQLILEQTPRHAARLQRLDVVGGLPNVKPRWKVGFADFSQRMLIQATMRRE